MDQDKRRERKNQLRREQRAKTRQDSLCMEYIRLKYNQIYTEAIESYNALNQKYPNKFDLRKTEEVKTIEPTDFPSPPTPCRLRFGEKFIYKDNIQLRIPLMCPSALQKTSNTETPTTETPTTETPNTETPTPETAITEVIQEGSALLEIPEDTIYPSQTPTPETAITEVIQEGSALPEIPEDTIYPSLFNELDQQLIDQIIDELRGDLDFKTIMTSVEEDMSYDMDIEMDVLDDYTLEKES